MSAPETAIEKFLQRWSRRKRGVAQTGTDDAASPVAAESGLEDASAFDLASLPPIESINAASDLRAFLAPGVPVDIARAALRRAWTTDPAIRDFIEIAENQWDFTKPETVPGFGVLDVTPELRRLAGELLGGPTALTATPEPRDISPVLQVECGVGDEVGPVRETAPVQPVQPIANGEAAHRLPTPRHGGALPR